MESHSLIFLFSCFTGKIHEESEFIFMISYKYNTIQYNRLSFIYLLFSVIIYTTNGFTLTEKSLLKPEIWSDKTSRSINYASDANVESFKTTIQFKLDTTKFKNEGDKNYNIRVNKSNENKEDGTDDGNENKDEKPKCVETSEFLLNGITWKFEGCQIQKGPTNELKNYLNISLVSVFNGESTSWSCEANATFTLLPSDETKTENVSKSFEYYSFNKELNYKGFDEFIEWSKMEQNYVNKNKEAIFRVEIEAKTPNRSSDLIQTQCTFRMRIKEVSHFNYQYSNDVTVGGISLNVLVMKKTIQNIDYLAIYLYPHGDDMDISKTWKVKAKFQINEGDKPAKTFDWQEFNWRTSSYGFGKFMTWKDLIDEKNKYVLDDATMIEVDLSVQEKTD